MNDRTSQTVKKVIHRCPFCEEELEISRMSCRQCDTQIESSLPIPRFFRLSPELQEFVLVFLQCRGNIREVEKALGISYPTVCKRLDLVNELLGTAAQNGGSRHHILGRLERGDITAKEATQLLKERSL